MDQVAEGEHWLTTAEEIDAHDITVEIRYALEHGCPGIWSLLWGLVMLRMRHPHMTPVEYLRWTLYRPEVTWEEVRSYVPRRDNLPLNDSLRDRALPQMDDILSDKLKTLRFFGGRDLPVVPVLALFCDGRTEADVHLLASRAEVAAFLASREGGIFGKPVASSRSLGTVAIDGRDAQGNLVLANGKTVPPDVLAAEIAGSWPQGYLFQPRIHNAAILRTHMGTATGSLRITTLIGASGEPEVLYAAQRCPSPGAMHDGVVLQRPSYALADIHTGQVINLPDPDDLVGPGLTHWLDPETPLVGMVLPGFAEACRIAIEGHSALPGHGILGWDIFLTDDGPLISEVNSNPMHALYQRATGKGLLAGDVGERIRARQRAVA